MFMLIQMNKYYNWCFQTPVKCSYSTYQFLIVDIFFNSTYLHLYIKKSVWLSWYKNIGTWAPSHTTVPNIQRTKLETTNPVF